MSSPVASFEASNFIYLIIQACFVHNLGWSAPPLTSVSPARSVRLTWCHVRQGAQGELRAHCPKVPSYLEAKIGYHIYTRDPSKNDPVLGYLHPQAYNLALIFATGYLVVVALEFRGIFVIRDVCVKRVGRY
jgi:hypothetical protein